MSITIKVCRKANARSVVEANLSVYVVALRRALGDGDAGSRYRRDGKVKQALP